MKKFEIPPAPSKAVSKIMHIRLPADLVEQVKKTISGTTCTFPAFIIAATRFALDDLRAESK